MFAGAVHLKESEIADMRRRIAQGLLPPDAIEKHFEAERMAVFGENYKTDRDGNPIEQGKGSKAQPTLQSVEAYRKYGKSEPSYEQTLAQMQADLAAYQERQEKAQRGRQATVRR
jgi:hypothetical protein